MKLHKMRSHRQHQQLSWRRTVLRKWLNIPSSNSDFSADSDFSSDSDSEQDFSEKASRFKNEKLDHVNFDAKEFYDRPKDSRFKNELAQQLNIDTNEALPRLRRRNSETVRAQYIKSKEIRICAATWNVGGLAPDDDLDLDGWLDIAEPADIYVIGFQEIIPLNAGNIFGAEDTLPVQKWENIIRRTLNRVSPMTRFKSYSGPPSPSTFQPTEDAINIEDEVALESDSDIEEGFYPVNEDTSGFYDGGTDFVFDDSSFPEDSAHFDRALEKELLQSSSSRRLDRSQCLKIDDNEENIKESKIQYTKILSKTLSGTEKIGLSWPEPPLDLLGQHILEKPNSFGSAKSFKTLKSLQTNSSFKSSSTNESTMKSDLKALASIDLDSLINRKRRPAYVRIVSKQMVGLFITVWVRRSLRRYIQNVNVSAVGVGAMGYIGNKGAVSVSMSVHQTVLCFVCTHLTAGEKEVDAVKRNADVHEIHRRSRFNFCSAMGLPYRIYDHERIIWLGDLNYRINLPYDQTRELISKKDWPKLLEQDQLVRELKKGRAFDGWSEGSLSFAPTYKYELNSNTYIGEDPKAGRRTPAWCDRILSFGKGMRLVDYRRSEIKLSDHRPVTATYMVEVEVFSQKKLQRALTFTDAEVKEEDIVTDVGVNTEFNLPMLEEDASY
ncbi:type IV inositol polyphosphate 5-phosphatase 3-like isoform X2 [Salvia hispanica]|uniref:type IV inositol polyphosphate 5-phosphatase 3-like isoform X2 n=1 Tax=Salvia hispanica TaxID=49212 RepID=UPI00200906EE|nr:type IV inositol polyphosphate 5-phosphatase 3-like isoform X2 [Salvia hispanica]